MINIKSIFLFLPLFILSNYVSGQKLYKEMMQDNSYNFYEVCKEADKYFEGHGTGKGSGYKGYQRWRNENESKYAPSGRRDNIDPLLLEKSYKRIFGNEQKDVTRGIHKGKWLDLGPYDLDSITGHYSAGLGRIVTSYVHRANTQIMYVGSRSGGFWKSTNGGTNWIGGSTDTLVASGVGSITASATNADSILIAVQNSSNNYSHGIYRSIDGGNSWIKTKFNPTILGKGGLGSNFRVYKVIYHPRVSDLIFIGTSDGLYRSSDNLNTWTKVVNGYITQIDFHPVNDSIVYVYDDDYWGAFSNNVLISQDQGSNFSASNTISGNSGRTGYLSVSNDCADCLFFASTNGIWTSKNKGVDFTFMSNPPESCLGFAVNDLDTSKMVYGYVDVVASSDGGRTSTQVSWWSLGNSNHGPGNYDYKLHNGGHYIHADLHPALCINGTYYVGTDGLFAKSTNNGATWTVISDGLGIRENYSLGASQSNHFRTMSGSQDNGTSIKHRDSWIEFYGADGMEAIIHPLNDDYMIGSVQYGTRRRTLNGGQTQNSATPAGQSGSGNGAWEAPLAYNPNDQMEVFNFAKDIYVSDQFGGNWQFRGDPFGGTISEAAIAENNSDIIVVSRGVAIRKSTDGGVSFASIKSNLPNYTITDIAFNPKNDDNIFVTYNRYQDDGQKIYMTINGGLTWSNITYNLNDMPIRCVVVDHTDSSNIYVGAEIGVFTMPLNGTSWAPYNNGLPNSTIRELEVVNGSNALKAAIWGRGLWEYTLVGREDYPAILTTRINDMPTYFVPKEDIHQHVTSVVSSDNPMKDVYMEWSINSPTFGNRIDMRNSMDSTYVSIDPIPNHPFGTKVFFKVFAVDSNDNKTETYKFQYTVQFNTRASIKEKSSNELGIKVFPNPTDGIVKIKFKEIINQGKATLYDELGKKIFTQQINGLSSLNFDIQECSNGVYFIVVETGGKRSIEKLIKK